jgi:hypothetical protein
VRRTCRPDKEKKESKWVPFIQFIIMTARIRAYSPRDEKEVRFMVGQAQMEPLAYANNRSEYPFCSLSGSRFFLFFSFDLFLTQLFISVLSSTDTCHMDWHFFHVCSIHGLVAQFLAWHIELVTSPASILRPSSTCDVLH